MTGPPDGRYLASALPVFVDDVLVVYEPASADDGSCIGWLRTTYDGDQQRVMLRVDGDSVVLVHDDAELYRWQP